MEVETRCVGDSHYTRGMLGSPTAMSASGPTSSPLLPTIPNSSPSQATLSRLTTAILAGDLSRTNNPHNQPPNPALSSPTTTSAHLVPNNASPRVSGLARASSVNAAASSSPRHSSAGSPRPPASSVTASPSIAARNIRRLSAPTTPLFRPSPSPRGQPRPSDGSARRNSIRTLSPLPNPQPLNPQPPPREAMASPPRRQRVESSVRLLPPLYQHCDTADLVVLISDMLGELVVLNDQIPLSTGGLTRFHSRAPPTISIPDYLSRLTLHSTLQPSILLSMVYYIDILSKFYPTFTISSLTVHRFLITAATVASKGLCDSFLTNGYYARVGGVSLMELNLLELEFLTRVGWMIVPRGEVLGEYYRSLVGRMGGTFGIDERAVGGREFAGEIAGQLMAGEIIPQPQPQLQPLLAGSEAVPSSFTATPVVGPQDGTQQTACGGASGSVTNRQQVQGGGG